MVMVASLTYYFRKEKSLETSVSRRNILGLAAAGLVGTTIVKPGFGKSFGSAAHDYGAASRLCTWYRCRRSAG